MKSYKSLIVLLVVVGAVNWGLVGLLDVNLVTTLFGKGTILEQVIYVLVGLAGLAVAWDRWGKAFK
jgi:uncharacterized membrane protein YuzA (DUF378 family)